MIRIENVNFSYSWHKEIFSGMSLSLEKNKVHGLLGCNGVGKSTLLKLISGLLIAQKGTVAVGGHNPAKRKLSFLEKIILIPEEFDLPHLTFAEFAKCNSVFYPSFSPELLGYYGSHLNIACDACLDRVSMGERKKAYIAFALACQPTYLFMDEPTNGLDIPSKSVFKELLSSFISPERTVVISTHQVADIQNLIDNVVIMDADGIVLNETAERIGRLLRFGAVRDAETALWSRDSLSGRVGVAPNASGQDSEVDIEMLFNAVQNNKQRIIEIMKNK